MGTPDPGDGRVQSDVRAEEAAAAAQADDERTVPELQDALRARGKPTSGNRQELLDRLAEPDDE